jgi:hypothetical protein
MRAAAYNSSNKHENLEDQLFGRGGGVSRRASLSALLRSCRKVLQKLLPQAQDSTDSTIPMPHIRRSSLGKEGARAVIQ